MNDEREEKREGLRAWHVALGIIGLLVVLIVLLMMAQKGSVERQLEALRAQGHPTSFTELAEQHQLPDDVENAADVYLEAFAAFRGPADSANTLCAGQAQLPAAGAPLPETIALATEQFLTDNQECLEWLRQAGGIERCRYDWDYVQGMPFLSSMKHCAQLLGAAIVSRGHQDDTAAVIAYLEDELHLIRSLQNEPGLISYLVRVACTALSVRALEQTLSAASFTDEQLAEMSRMLTEAALMLDLTQTMVSERCFMIEYIRDPSKLGRGGTGALRIPGLGGLGLADILDYMADCVAASELAPPERVVRFRQIRDELEDLSFLHMVVKIMAPALGRVAELDLRCKAHLDLARSALAIERYRLATGKVPEQLEELVPQYLDAAPLDPFDGQPIRYRRSDAGYRLYSITEDGQDDGGLSRDEVNKGESYDLCFIVTR
jgi:hypothetical protein